MRRAPAAAPTLRPWGGMQWIVTFRLVAPRWAGTGRICELNWSIRARVSGKAQKLRDLAAPSIRRAAFHRMRRPLPRAVPSGSILQLAQLVPASRLAVLEEW